MHRFFIICFLLIPFVAFGEIKKITKTEKVVVPHNQSVEQVLNYTSEKLARIAAEEAGVAISSNTTLVDGKISKDEIKMQTSAIAQKETKLLKQETINGITYITVQVTASVDSAELDAFLRQLMQNEALKKELEQEREAKLALEKKLKKASKEEYDSTLSKEAENIAKVQKARQKQLEIEMANAKQQFMEAERRQKQEELEAMRELERIEKEYKAQDAALQKKIAAEKNAEAKAEMEHQALLAELAQNALINDKKLDTTASDTIEIIVIDAGSVRVNFAALIKEYKIAMDANEKKMNALYKTQMDMLKKQTFKEQKPKKGEWEQTESYNAKVEAYNARKEKFEEDKIVKIKELEDNHKLKLANSRKESTKSLIKALTPLYERLVKYSEGRYATSNTAKAVISFGERDIDNMQLPIKIKYRGNEYNFIYQFESIGEFRVMYETRASFKATPLFAAEAKGTNKAMAYLKGFNVVHLGNNKEKFFEVNDGYNIFPEIIEYRNMQDEVSGKKISENESAGYGSFKQNTSDVNIKKQQYKRSYWLYGLNLAGGFNGDALLFDFTSQIHWRFNRVLGLYTNFGLMVGVSGISSNNSRSYDYNDYDDDNYYYGSSSTKRSSSSVGSVDSSLYIGLGLDIYVTDNVVLFGEVNGGYFYDERLNSNFGAIFKGGLALHYITNVFGDVRLSVFLEQIITDTTSGKTPFFGAGLQF